MEWSGGRSTLRRGGVCAGAHAEQATRFLLGRHRLGRGALPGKAFDAAIEFVHCFAALSAQRCAGKRARSALSPLQEVT